MLKATDIIESARTYYLLSNDHVSKPMLAGNRIKLEFALQGIKSDMVIATSGNDKRCVVLMDLTADEIWALIQKGDRMLMKLRRIKAKN